MELGLAGKTVIVTGGGSNIGRSITLAFANEGSNVVIADLDEAQAKKVAEQAKASAGGGQTMVIKTDVAQSDAVQEMVKKTLDKFGTIDVLVNNVGWNFDEYFMDENPEKWDKVINLNFKGMIYCTNAVLSHMIEQKKGSIVSIGSDAGRMGEFREGVYAGCKAGVIALTKTLVREVGRHGIRLNVVCPGATIPTDPDTVGEMSMGAPLQMMTPEQLEGMIGKMATRYPARRIGKPHEVANAVVFLASDAASFIYGQTISVSGGYTMM